MNVEVYESSGAFQVHEGMEYARLFKEELAALVASPPTAFIGSLALEMNTQSACSREGRPSEFTGCGFGMACPRRMERATGIGPALSAWEADVIPLHYAREWLYWASIERDGKVANHVAK